jgi:hypothetical protein
MFYTRKECSARKNARKKKPNYEGQANAENPIPFGTHEFGGKLEERIPASRAGTQVARLRAVTMQGSFCGAVTYGPGMRSCVTPGAPPLLHEGMIHGVCFGATWPELSHRQACIFPGGPAQTAPDFELTAIMWSQFIDGAAALFADMAS